MYSICSAYKQAVQEVLKKTNNRSFAITTAIYQFNFYLPSNNYTEIVEPLECVFNLFLALARIKKSFLNIGIIKDFK